MFLSLFLLSLTTCLLKTVNCQSKARCMFQESLYGRFIHPCRNFEGDSCTYSCYSNFNPPTVISTTIVTCTSSGSWTGNLECSDPVKPTASTLDPNEPVIIQQPIYPNPPSIGVPSSPESGTCPEIQDFENGIAQGFCKKARNGSICSFRCHEGFELKGVKRLKCNGQSWDDELPVCQERGPGSEECRPLLPPGNASLSGSCKIPSLGSVCSLICDPGFRPVGDSKLTCTAKGWTNENPRCVDMTCKAITPPENGYLVGDCDPGVVGNFCAFACKKGYALVGPSVLFCNYQGIWDPAEQATCYPLASCGLNPPSTTTIELSSLSPPQPTTQSSEQPESTTLSSPTTVSQATSEATTETLTTISQVTSEATTETLTTVPQTTPQIPTETTPIVVSQSSSSTQAESVTQTPPVVTSQPTSMQQPETQTISTIISVTSEQPEVLTQTPSIIVSETSPKQPETQTTPSSQMASSEKPEYLTQTVADSAINHSHTEEDISQWEVISDVTTQIYPTGHPIRETGETRRRGRMKTTENNQRVQ